MLGNVASGGGLQGGGSAERSAERYAYHHFGCMVATVYKQKLSGLNALSQRINFEIWPFNAISIHVSQLFAYVTDTVIGGWRYQL